MITISDRQVKIVIAADVAQAIRGMREVEQGLGRVGEQGEQASSQASGFGEKIKEAFASAGVVGGIAGVAAAIGFTIKQGVAFEDNLNSLKAVSGATADQMAAVSARARELGSDIDLPATSAGDAAEAMLELAKGGLTVSESMSAARGTLLLAAAAGITGAEAAEIQANALNAFSLSADDANHVADVLANTANQASGEITDFAAGLAQSASVAHAFGIGIEDSATVLGLFANAGIKGSDAGTSFKTMLTALASPTKQQAQALETLNLQVYDAEGNFVGMKSVTEQLAAAHGTLTQEQYNSAASTAFGADAIRGANILAEGGVAAWDNMASAVGRAGGAQEVAAARTEGLSGAFGKFMSAVEDLALTLYSQFSPALQDVTGFATTLVGGLSDLVGWFSDLPGPIQAVSLALLAVVALRGPLGALWVSIRAGATGAMLAVKGELLAVQMQMRSVQLSAAATGTSMGVMGASMRVAGVAALGFGNTLKAAFLSNPIGLVLVAATTALSFFVGATDDAAGATDAFSAAVDGNTGALTENARTVIARAAAESGAAAAYKAAGGNVADYTAALAGNTEKQDLVRKTLTDAANAAREAGISYDLAAVGADGMGTATGESVAVLGEQAGAFDSANSAAAQFEADLAGVNAAQETGKLAAEGAGTAIEGEGEKAAAATDPMESLKSATEALGSAAQVADAAVQFLALSLDAASGGAISQEAAWRASEAALRGIKSAASDYASAQDGITESGLKVAAAQAKVDEVTQKLGLSQEEGGTTADDLTQAQLDLAEANRVNQLASDKVTDATDKQFDANVQARDSALAFAIAQGQLTGKTGTLTQATDSATSALDGAKAAFIAAQPEADRLSGKAQVTADKLFGIPKDTIAKIAEQGAFNVQQAADATKGKLDGVEGTYTATLSVIDNISATVNSVAARLINLDGFTATATTRNVTINETISTGTGTGPRAQEDGGVVYAAAGRLVRGRGTSQVRDGAGPGLTWAESATNKEYYLSMKTGMEGRNRALASQAVNDLGGQAMWGAAGDVRNGTFQPAPVVNIQVTNYLDGTQIDSRTESIVDGKLSNVARKAKTARGQSWA